MYIIVGLGNPGSKYAETRHNIGFKVIDRISEKYGIQLNEKDFYIIGKGAAEGVDIILLKPLTFMNKSGIAVRKALRKTVNMLANYSDKLIVVHDDLDLETGIIRIRKNGSSGGHKGIESIILEIGTRDFIRLKLGIGRDREMSVEEYVLRNFRPDEKDAIKNAIINAVDAVTVIVTQGVQKAMNTYNRKIKAGI
jgi:PTH1 family peptidyl-tRNA hydrolase